MTISLGSMLNIFFVLTILLATTGAVLSLPDAGAAKWDKKSRQMVVVTSDGWDNVAGHLQRFSRASPETRWQSVGSPIAVVVGRGGLAWGRGLHPTNAAAGPQKREGDGKSPAGVFALSAAFGFAPAEDMQWLKLPYLHLTEALECVDDVNSLRYNSIVDNTHILDPDWNSSEKMRAIGEQYRLGVIVDHNTAPRLTGNGSCIFIHIWKGDDTGTAGCTAMEKRAMEQLIRWLDAKANPVLVQLPEVEFRQRKSAWRLLELKLRSNDK